MEPNKVELDYQEGFWIVKIREDGQVTERTFIFMQGARSYAEGQAYRISGSFRYIDKTR